MGYTALIDSRNYLRIILAVTLTVAIPLFASSASPADDPAPGESPSAGPVVEGTPPSTAQPNEPVSPPEAGDVQERGVIRDHRTQPGTFVPSQPNTPAAPLGKAPQLMMPSIPLTAVPVPSGQALPLPNSPPPTVNIAAVANAMRYDHKSLSTVMTVPPGLPLAKPVTISVGYFPTGVAGYGRYCQQRVTQTYASPTGNTFLCALPEGDGRPRPLHLDITFSEPKPGGGLYNYNVPVDMALDPLYDVAISPLIFTLISGCSTIGANQIDLNWYPPDKQAYQKVHFATKEREVFTIREFSWAQSEVSAAANFHSVSVWYAETGIHGGFGPIPGTGGNLVPGKTYTSSPGLIHSMGSTQDCQATLNYTVTYTFRQYFGAAPDVRDHR